jgi:hypothetical protein
MVHKEWKSRSGSGDEGDGSHLCGQGQLYSAVWLAHAAEVRQINKLARDQVESKLIFAGFLVFHCPLKADAVEALKMLADSSHRVCL